MKILGLATCYNRKEKTLYALQRLVDGNKAIEFHFIIADDNSSDGTKKALEQLDNVQILSGNGSLFYSGGMRLAIGEALKANEEYDYCMLFNDDVAFFDGAIEILSHKSNQCIWVGPTCDEQGKLSYGGVIKKSLIRPKTEIVMASSKDGLKCHTFNANCVLIPWIIFRRIGNMDVAYSHSLGDFDYGFHASKIGVEIRVSDTYVGKCCDNPASGSWRDKTLPRKKRLKLKESPKGLPRREWFHYLRKNYSICTALVWSLIPYVKILFYN